jgi:ubiquinone/menaquinone biosynthesis C-methylase UbiE
MELYDRVTKTVRHRVLHKYEPKDDAELSYWLKADRVKGKHRDNAYFERLFTEMFELPREYFTGKSLLDIGCGPCGSLEWAGDAKRRVGLDPLAEKYRELDVAGSSSHQMEYLSSPVESMPFDASTFDVVSSLNSLDHVDDLTRALSEIHRVLSPGGLFLLEVEFGHRPTACEPVEIPADLIDQLGDRYQAELHRQFLAPKNYVHNAYLEQRPYPAGSKKYLPGVMVARLRKI